MKATPSRRADNLLDEHTGWRVLYTTGSRQWLAIDEYNIAHMDHEAVTPQTLSIAMDIAKTFYGYVSDLDNIVIRLYNVVSGENIPYTGLLA